MNKQQFLDKVEHYVAGRFSDNNSPAHSFYNLEHTRCLVKTVKDIAGHTTLDKRDQFQLEIAAWFHDAGFTGNREDEVPASAELAHAFLEKEEMDEISIQKITTAIVSTGFPQHPVTLFEEVLCDALFFYLGKKSFIQKIEQLRQDTAVCRKKEISEIEWLSEMVELMNGHKYCTAYCRSLLDEKKEKNLEKLNNTLAGLQPKPHLYAEHHTGKSTHEKEKNNPDPEKAVDTMMRVSSSNNQKLLAIADRKAHILITVNAITLSLIISFVLKKLDENSFLIYPTYFLSTVALAAITFSILATRPLLPDKTFRRRSHETGAGNLLYFENFYKLSLTEYTDDMLAIMGDRALVYQTLIGNIYYQGLVLERKYSLLRTAYTIFMYGLIISILGFIVAYAIHHDASVSGMVRGFNKPVKMHL